MAKYRTIQPNYWNDPYIETLPPEGRAFYMYLMTSPHTNNLGVLEISHAKMAFETGWPVDVVERVLSILENDGKITTDGNFILVNNFIKNQSSTSPKILLNLKEHLCSLESPKLLKVLAIGYPVLEINIDTLSIPYQYPINTVSIPPGEVELELELELELERELEREREEEREKEGEVQKGKPSSPPIGAASCPHGKIVSLFSETLPELPAVKNMSQTRISKLKTRWREDKARQNLDWWREYFLTVKASDFLMGRVPGREGKAPFLAVFDWLVEPSNMTKVLEGNYANRASPAAAKPRYERPPTAAEHMRAMSDRLRAEAENEEDGGIIDISTGGDVLFDGRL